MADRLSTGRTALALLALVAGGCLAPTTEEGSTGTRPTTTSTPLTTTSTPPTTTSTPPTTTSTPPTTTTGGGGSGGTLQVLVFSRTEGFRHESIRAGVAALASLGDRVGFETAATEDPAFFTGSALERFHVVVFLNTTGDVLDDDQQTALEDFVRGGNGFVGVHSAADTEYDWPWYGGLVGAWFDRHPRPQTAMVTVAAPDHPALGDLPGTFERFDEWYDFRSRPAPEVEILATLDETTYDGARMGDPHPISWAHEYEGGRSFYTGCGHTEESYAEPIVLDHLGAAITWAGGGR